MDVNLLKQKLGSEKIDERLSGLREAIAESEALAVYVIKDYIKVEKSDTVLAAMLIACAKIGGSAEIDFIGSFLEHSDFKVQKYAFQSLLLIDSDEAGPYIIKTLTVKEPRLKQMAVKAVRNSGKPKCLAAIELMLISDVEWQRISALEVLEMLNNILYENELIDILVKAVCASKKECRHESLEKLKKIYETGSEYAAICIKKLTALNVAPDVRRAVLDAINDGTLAEAELDIKFDPAGVKIASNENTAGSEAVNVTNERKQPVAFNENRSSEDEIINDFSHYIDDVVKKRPSRNIIVSSPQIQKINYSKILFYILYSLKHILFFPFKFVYEHKYKFGALILTFVFLYVYIFPEFILGSGYFSELKPASLSSLDEQLRQKGYILNHDAAGAFLAFSHKYWLNTAKIIDNYMGTSVIFSAYEINLKNSEIFEGRVFWNEFGVVTDINAIRNLTETSMADEEELVVMKSSFAYLSNARNGLKVLTVQDGNYSNKRQFLFKQNVEISNITNSALAVNLLKVETKKGENLRNVSLNVDSGSIDPPDFPVEYIPYIEADEPFVPMLVEKVRNLGFVGPEKIARLEDIYYNTTDYFKRKLYSGYEEEEDSGRIIRGSETDEINEIDEINETEKIGEINKTNETNLVNVISTIAKMPVIISTDNFFYDYSLNVMEFITQFKTGAVLFGDIILKSADAVNAGFKNEILNNYLRVMIFKDFTSAAAYKSIYAAGPAPALISEKLKIQNTNVFSTPAVPVNIEPLLKKNSLKNEGVWTSAEISLSTLEQPLAFKTKLRVDVKRTFAVMHFLCIELAKINLALMPGTNEPVSSIGLKGKGVIPRDAETYQNLICAFNGGFRTKHGKWGFIADGVSYMPPVKGIATIMVDADGGIKMGTWGGPGFETTENIIHLRQNLPPILENNVVNMKHDYWGASIDNKTRVWRSALGITRDGKWLVYGAGNSLGHDTLAAGMSLAGCDYAMQLDINDYHTYLYTYRHNGMDKKGNLKLKASRLSDEMSGETQRCLAPYTRDFFYVTFKSLKNTIIN